MSHLPSTYVGLLDELKGRIQVARTRAALAVNAERVRLYGKIGRTILERQEEELSLDGENEEP